MLGDPSLFQVVKDLIKNKLESKYPNLTDQQLNELVRLSLYSRLYGRSGSKEATLARALSNLSFKNSSSVVPKISVPFVMSGGKPTPDVSKQALDGYMLGVGQLDNYFSNNPLPSNMDPNKLKVVIHSTAAKFAAFYRALGTKHSESYIRDRVAGFNSVDRESILSSGKLIPDFAEVTSTIGLNPELEARLGGRSTFEGGNNYAETVTHEFAHSLHRAISFMFGNNSGLSSELDFNKEYRAIKRQFVSEYGRESFAEHFAEAFSRYMANGEATPEFKQFLQKFIHKAGA